MTPGELKWVGKQNTHGHQPQHDKDTQPRAPVAQLGTLAGVIAHGRIIAENLVVPAGRARARLSVRPTWLKPARCKLAHEVF